NEIAGEDAIDINETAFAPDKVLKRADEKLKWKKTFTRRKNKLHRLVNKLKIWDYSFTERIIIELVKINCEYYGNPDIVEFATDSDDYKELKAATEKLLMLADKIKDATTSDEEHENRKEFYTTLAKYIEWFWE
ncbi:MAG: hypothetical protein J6Y43_08435, partial [Clostridia bacterium]|nr:hypothetical protein [Clostridia bacterium]